MTKSLASLAFFAVSVTVAMAQTTVESEYYPLKVGHRWTYRATSSKSGQPASTSHKVIIEVEVEEPFVRPKAKDKEEPETRTGYILRSTSGGKITFDYVVVMEEGVHRARLAGTPVNPAGTQITPPLLFLKLNPDKTPNDKWEANSISASAALKGTFTAKVGSVKLPYFKNEARQALAVSFRSAQADSPIEIDYWFVPKVGMVRQRVKTKDHEIVLELENFEPAKGK